MTPTKGVSKSETLQNTSESSIELLLIGEISTSYSLETFPNTQSIEIPRSLVASPENSYVIRIKGDGFVDELLRDGDLIIVEARSNAEEGETVIAMVESQDPLIKIYGHESDMLSSMDTILNNIP